jgi:hypothetical protein
MESARYFCQVLMEFELGRQIFEKHSHVSFHENASSGNRVVPRGQKDGQGQTDMTKLRFAFPNFAKPPEEDMY